LNYTGTFFIGILLLHLFSSCSKPISNESNQELLIDRQYYESGKIKRKFTHKGGRPMGMDSSFYESGKLKTTYQWVDSLLIHEGLEFYDKTTPMLVHIESDTFIMNYPLIKTYTHFNSRGTVAYLAEYDEESNITNSTGDAIVSVFLEGSSYQLTIFFARPPKTSTRLIVRRNHDETTSVDTLELKNTRFDYEISNSSCESFTEILFYYSIFNKSMIHKETLRIYCKDNIPTMERIYN